MPPRADARRSRQAILDAAVHQLSTDHDRSIETIAAAAGVTRQTVYAHFPTRDHLIAAAVQHATDIAVTALDNLDLDRGTAGQALLTLLDTGAEVTRRYRTLFQIARTQPVTPEDDRRTHEPINTRLARVIHRGQQTGEFDPNLPATWLATAVIHLAHTAADAVDAGLMTHPEATRALHTTTLRLLTPTRS